MFICAITIVLCPKQCTIVVCSCPTLYKWQSHRRAGWSRVFWERTKKSLEIIPEAQWVSRLLWEGLGNPREVPGSSRKVQKGDKVTFLACTLEKFLLNGVMWKDSKGINPVKAGFFLFIFCIKLFFYNTSTPTLTSGIIIFTIRKFPSTE